MSKELIERLRDISGWPETPDFVAEAADTIEKQQSWIASLEQNARDADRLYKELETELAASQAQIETYAEREKTLMAAIMESTKLSDNLYCKGHKLAFVLECILLATDSDMAAISKYWDEAHAALEEWRK